MCLCSSAPPLWCIYSGAAAVRHHLLRTAAAAAPLLPFGWCHMADHSDRSGEGTLTPDERAAARRYIVAGVYQQLERDR